MPEKSSQEPGDKRPVKVTDENRPPGDPGPGVDIQEHVGGQPGHEDPGATGGHTHEDLGIEKPADEPSAEAEAGNHRLEGLKREREPEPEAHRHGGVPSSTSEEGTDLERQFRENVPDEE